MGRRKNVIIEEIEDEVLHVSGLKVKTADIFNDIRNGLDSGSFNININFNEVSQENNNDEKDKK